MDPLHKTDAPLDEENASKEAASNAEAPKETTPSKPVLTPAQAYAKRMGNFILYYRQLLVFICMVALLGVVVAVVRDVLIGTCIAILSAVLYLYFVSDELFKKLGLQYKSTDEGVEITRCRPRYGNTYYVPPMLIGMDVIRVSEEAFHSPKCESLEELYLPATLQTLPASLFEDCKSLTAIYFSGDEEAWHKLWQAEIPEQITVYYNAEYPIPVLPKKAKAKK